MGQSLGSIQVSPDIFICESYGFNSQATFRRKFTQRAVVQEGFWGSTNINGNRRDARNR